MSDQMRDGALIDHGDPLFHSVSAKLRRYNGDDGVGVEIDEPFSICRVPPRARKVDPSAYEPEVVSIGPYHRQNPKLRAMEDHKWRYMHNLFRRRRCSGMADQSDSADEVLKRCIDKVRRSEARARRCYQQAPNFCNMISNNDFVMVLVLDGCFILELFLTCFHNDEVADDLIHAIPWMFPAIWRDLIKLENQIPFFILQDLFTAINNSLSLEKLAFRYLEAGPLALADPFEEEQEAEAYSNYRCHLIMTTGGKKIYLHLLHFYHMLLKPSTSTAVDQYTADAAWTGAAKPFLYRSSVFLKKVKNYLMPHIVGLQRKQPSLQLPNVVREPDSLIPCVVELREAGIKFRRKLPREAKASLLDVTFKDGVLHVPRLSVEDNTKTAFRNLLAFEQFCPNNWHYVTTYTTFLDCIVNTAKDVTVLQQRGIIRNMLGSEDELALLINRLGKDVTVCHRCHYHYLERLFREVNEYCESKWHKHRASCMRDYFGTPWSMLSVFAAIALLLMTLVQVIFAILSYRKQ